MQLIDQKNIKELNLVLFTMPIIGIDKDKCTNCKLCLQDCPTKNFTMDENQEQVIFDNY